MTARLTPELARCLALLGELGAIGRALDAAGVEHAVLKGLPLAVRLTGRIDGRQRRIRDADILVRRRPRFLQALRSARCPVFLNGCGAGTRPQRHAWTAHASVVLSPSSKPVVAWKAKRSRARETSNRLRGWPFGLELSQAIRP